MLNLKKEEIDFIAVILIVLLSLVAYSNSFESEFVYDDELLVRANIYIKSWRFLPEIFTTNLKISVDNESNFYRPLQNFTYLINYSLWGLYVPGYHIFNLLLHILTVLLMYLLVTALFGNRLLSLFTGLLFISHPVHTEAVTYISGRADLLAAVFVLLALFLYVKNLTKPVRNIAIMLALVYMLAMLSKEYSVILPILILFYHYIFRRKLKLPLIVFLFVITVAYFSWRIIFIRGVSLHGVSDTSVWQRLPGFFVAITSYVKILLFPVDLHMEYGKRLFQWNDYRVLMGVFIVLFLLMIAIRERSKCRLISFSIGWFFLTLLPVANIYPINAYMAEHWLYLPSLGFFLVLAHGLISLLRQHKFRLLAIILFIVIICSYSWATIKQNNYWSTSKEFYERTLQYSPGNTKILNNLAITYHYRNETEKGFKSLKKAIQSKPEDARAYFNMGVLYTFNRDYDKAIQYIQKSINRGKKGPEVFCLLAHIYSNSGKEELAIQMLEEIIYNYPNYGHAYCKLAFLYGLKGDKKKGLNTLAKSIDIDPDCEDIPMIKNYLSQQL